MKIILASGSPRRYDLLKQMGWDVEVRSLPFSEVETVNEATEQLIQLRKNFLSADSTQQDITFCEKDLVLLSQYRDADLVCAYNALGKGKAAAAVTRTWTPVIAADTIVVLGNIILGKPTDPDNAKDMLRQLSGNVHEVKTASVSLRKKELTGMSAPASRWTRPAHTAFRAKAPRWWHGSKAVTIM